MGMQLGGSKSAAFADMNVVPLIDILLVLLVIFMLMPSRQKGLDAEIPKRNMESHPEPEPEAVVVEVQADGSLSLNRTPVQWDRLAERLEEVYKARAQRVALIRGESSVHFAVVARAIDIMRGLGISVGLLTPKLEQTR
jgi:biopolymer transport protein TolR